MHHIFELIVDEKTKEVTSVPDCENAKIRVGDTVAFQSSYGKFRIDWTDNVFDAPAYECSTQVVKAGEFNGKCTFTMPDGQTLTWEGSGTKGKSEDDGTGDPG